MNKKYQTKSLKTLTGYLYRKVCHNHIMLSFRDDLGSSNPEQLNQTPQLSPSRNSDTIVFIGCESSKLPQHLQVLCSRSQCTSQLQILPGNFNLIFLLFLNLIILEAKTSPTRQRQTRDNPTGADGSMEQQKHTHFYFSKTFQGLIS